MTLAADLTGVFVGSCPCKYFLGFQVMLKAEGPRFFNHILYTRFETAPQVVFYDNGEDSKMIMTVAECNKAK